MKWLKLIVLAVKNKMKIVFFVYNKIKKKDLTKSSFHSSGAFSIKCIIRK